MPAKIIMFDGPDGVGKTTQIQKVADKLTDLEKNVLVTRINGGSPIGEELRKVYLSNVARPAGTDFYLGLAIYEAFIAETNIQRPNHDIILVDRSPLSNVAYQAFGSGYPLEESVKACEDTLAKLQPNLIICYEAPLHVLRARLSDNNAKADYFESKPDEYFEKVIQGYEYCSDRFGVAAVDASGDAASVHEQTMKLVTKALE